MYLQFKCHNCGEYILVKFLKVGQIAECKHCGAKNAVPENVEPFIPKPEPESAQERKRGGCLTVFLIFMIIGNSIVFLINFRAGLTLGNKAFQSTPGLAITVLILLNIAAIVFAIAILKWKKWGYYGICVCYPVSIIFNIILTLILHQNIYFVVSSIGWFFIFLSLINPIRTYLE